MGLHRARQRLRREQRAEAIEDMSAALAGLFDGKKTEQRIRNLRKR